VASAELERRVRAWATMRAFGLDATLAEEVAVETCAEVWRTLNLARGGAAFEGFVQGRFVEALRRASSGHEQTPVSSERVLARLSELRLRNPRHHRAIALLYQDQATPAEAADELGVDVWTLRSLLARARLSLVQSRERPRQQQRTGDGRRPAAKPTRAGNRPGQKRQGRPPSGGRPR
jgi:DNA-directed RNA polymerase specialized sigma24 family protein